MCVEEQLSCILGVGAQQQQKRPGLKNQENRDAASGEPPKWLDSKLRFWKVEKDPT
jgi:hypothetical protein